MTSFDNRNVGNVQGRKVGDWIALLAGRRSKWVTLVVALAVSAAALVLVGAAANATSPTAGLPPEADSTAVVALQQGMPRSKVDPVFVVLRADSGQLSRAHSEQVAALSRQLGADVGAPVPPPTVSRDASTALMIVPLPADLSDSASRTAVEEVRATVRSSLPPGLTAQVTGGPAFQVDIASAFDGANVTLLITTASVVAVLLLITYRSPWLWLVPLTVVGVADRVATQAVAAATQLTSLRVNESTVGIVSVLVFGAGTNYALLLIARYREELRTSQDRHRAMAGALRQAAPAVLASSGTVTLALLTLGVAGTPNNQTLGYAGAIGIITAVVYALGVLPAALVLFGRRLFWPFVPRVGQPNPARSGLWARAGQLVVRRPALVAASSVVLLAALAAGAFGVKVGLSQTEQFTTKPESVLGQENLARAFPAGISRPAAILAPVADRVAVEDAARAVPGVSRVSVGDTSRDLVQLDAVMDPPPGTTASFDTVRALRQSVAAASSGRALVGGSEALDLDSREAAAAEQRLVIPLILAVVVLILLAVLRSVVAAGLLILTVVLSYAAALGVSWLIFDRLTTMPALDLGIPLLSFLFLVALGVDYNIFLATRAREEAQTLPTAEAMVNALSVTGGVITSAGILLAAVFAVLGVLPVIALTQLGVIVGVGVLLDTLLVRTLLVPALAALTGAAFWWPGDPQHRPYEPRRALRSVATPV
ncbi:MAG TPA: MMPL family transporter [Propionibacteriaceae bacterium]|nr:MMPL family transporter [Propionibacteriaceae bacterium]